MTNGLCPTAHGPRTVSPTPQASRRRRGSRALAYHETGHAVSALYFGNGLDHRRASVTVRARFPINTPFVGNGSHGRCRVVFSDWFGDETARAVTALAGPLAEELGAGTSFEYADDAELYLACEDAVMAWPQEFWIATDICQCAYTVLAFRGSIEADDLVKIIRSHEATARELLARPLIWAAVVRLANALMERHSLNGGEAAAVVGAEIIHGVLRRD